MAISYKLTVIHKKEDGTSTEYPIVNGKEITIDGIPGSSFSLNDVFFNRRVYSPNELLADVQVTGTPTAEDIQKNIEGKEVKFTIENEDSGKSQVFSNLYVHEVMILRSGTSSTYLRLRIYSNDYQLTTKKYSRTYVAKRLGRDILMEGTGGDTNKNSIQIAKYWINQNLAKSHPIELDIANDDVHHDVGMTDYLQFLKWKDDSKKNEKEKKDGKMEEIILPYLVQYNESFYDFISRTANRCGEFLYFEEGQLHLGLHTTSTGLAGEITNSECNEIFGNQSKFVDNDFLSRDEVSEVWKEEGTDKKAKWSVNWMEFDADDDKKYAIKKSTDSLQYDFEVNEEPYHNRLYKKKFSSFSTMKNMLSGTFLWGFFGKVLKENTLYNIIKSVATMLSRELYEANMANTDMQTLWKNKVYDEQKHINTNLQKSGKDDEENITPFVAQGDIMTNERYHKIRNGEENVSASTITFNLGTNIKFLQVGQTLTYGGKEYIVIQVKLNPRLNKSRFNAIDLDAKEETASMSNSHMQVKVVPVLSAGKYPPMHSKGHVLRAEPQVAFVTDHGYMDPLQQGRVRIRYPWEASNATPSPWLRIVVPAATPGGGFYAEPGDGDEVLVCYEAGNIERPYVGGFLRNRDRNHAFLRGDMYMISKNGHGICFNDPVDASLFFQGLSPTLKSVKTILAPLSMLGVKALEGIPIIGSGPESDAQSLLNLTGGMTLRDAYGLYSISMSTDQRKVDISSPFGTVSVNAFTGITISAPNGDISIKGKNVTIEAGNQLKMVSGLNIDTGHTDEFMKRGGVKSAILSLAADLVTDFVKETVQIIDLKLLRCVMEIILRPVNGTTQIKSYNHLVLEAGPGMAALPIDKYKDESTIKKQLQDERDKDSRENADKHAAITGLIEKIAQTLNEIIGNIHIGVCLTNVQNKIVAFNTCVGQCEIGGVFNGQSPTAKPILEAIWDNNDPDQHGFSYTKDTNGNKYNDLNIKEQIPDGQNENVASLVRSAETLSESAYELYQSVKSSIQINALAVDALDAGTKFYGHINGPLNDTLKDNLKFGVKDEWTDVAKISVYDPNIENKKTLLKRLVFAKILADIKGLDDCPITTDMTLSNDGSNWAEYLASIRYKPANPVVDPMSLKKFGKDMADVFIKAKNEYKGIFTSADRNVWKNNKEGQIVFSDQYGYSCYFDRDGSFHRYKTTVNFDINEMKQQLSNF